MMTDTLNNLLVPDAAAPVLREIERGMGLKKCRKCGCMADALSSAARAFSNADDPQVHALMPVVQSYQARMEPIAYDCIGCKKCWGADATIRLAERFEEVDAQCCGSACPLQPAAHLGRVSLVGVVGIIKANQGFVLIDTREYHQCGLSCLTEAGTPKVPVRWTGVAPQVKQTVRVSGNLEKTGKGYALTALTVAKQ